MEPMVYRSTGSPTEIMRKLDESRKHLKLNNLFSCIVTFREVLNDYINASGILRADKIKLAHAINEFQQRIASSYQFRDLYGAFTFRDDDFHTSYEFFGQLIKIKEDEIAGVLINKDVGQSLNLDNLSEEDQQKALMMISLVERGEQMALLEMVSQNDDVASLVFSYYNDNGINCRITGDTTKAIQEYKKALSISPDDEHLYYNIARVFIEMGDKRAAEDSINMAMKINPEFYEGLKLQNYIIHWTP